jgi:ubiquinol oxidase
MLAAHKTSSIRVVNNKSGQCYQIAMMYGTKTDPANGVELVVEKQWSSATTMKPVFTEKQVEEHYMKNHIPLSHATLRQNGEPYTNTAELDVDVASHVEAKDFVDKVAHGIMRFLRVFVHAFFGKRYIHHAVVLETVAAVPGMVAGCLRHFNSLRRMARDYGWIGSLVEEAENERMHLLTWMQVTKPNFLERLLVIAAQIGYTTFYTFCYVLSPRFSHRMVGYLEEEAVSAYTQFLEAIDNGSIPNVDAPEIAKKYWNLPPNATLRDVVLVVRADECMHRDYNHKLALKSKADVF